MEVMDYEKKYKNALEHAKECLKDGGISQNSINYIESIFPELKESEDEKMRKKCIELIKELETFCMRDGQKECIAWLEKQGEKKYTAEEVLIKAGLKPYKDGDQWCILLGDNVQEGICGFGDTIDDALYAFLNDLIKSQKEQKPVDFLKANNLSQLVGMLVQDIVANEKDAANFGDDKKPTSYFVEKYLPKFEQLKMPAEWSDYDSWAVNTICYIMNQLKGNTLYPEDKTAEKCIEWLENLKYRVQPVQPKQEWSEEDEKMLQYAIEHFEVQKRNSIEGGLKKEAMQEFIDWLKSLRPQSHWKPSDEQMLTLEAAIADYTERGLSYVKDGLNNLYEQLKKL